MSAAKGKAKALDDPAPMTMAERLRQYRDRTNRRQVPELDLLRDILYVLQGIDGKHVKFRDPSKPKNEPPIFDEDGELLAQPALEILETDGIIPKSTQDLLHRLAELGLLFREIDSGLKSRAAESSRGLIEQSLAHAIQKELTAYFHLIALLESRVGEAKPPDSLDVADQLQPLDDSKGLTLRRVVVYTEDMKLRLRFAGVMVEGCSNAHGGALVSLIHRYTAHGDPFVRSFTDALLDEVSKPFFTTLAKWIHEGELVDPFEEFFVEEHEIVRRRKFVNGEPTDEWDDEGSAGQPSLWERKFSFNEAMLPDFVGKRFGKKIFSTGKSLNFLKHSCGEAQWVSGRLRAEERKALQYSDIAGLEHSIDAAYSVASKRLLEVLFERFNLMDHLRALKDYLMLGKGDFVEVLMEHMAPNLGKPASTLYRHSLTAVLEDATRSSTAANDNPAVLERLDAKMTDEAHDVTGWDAFTLEYTVESPINTVLDEASMGHYKSIFAQLWQMKRIEMALSSAWQRIVAESNTYGRISELAPDFHRARITLAAMTHFIRSLQSFCHLDTIETGWQDLEAACKKADGDLDGLLDKHTAYLERLTQRILLNSVKAGKEDALLMQARDIFRLILQFTTSVDALCSRALEMASDVASRRDAERGVPMSRAPSMAKATTQLSTIRDNLQNYGARFDESMHTLYAAVASHKVVEMRSLSARLNFNYREAKQKKGKAG